MASKSTLDDLRMLIRSRKLRATPSRIAVLGLLIARAHPLSHADVSEQLGAHGWDPATLYRNLTDLVDVGLARRTDVGDHVWRFEIVGDEHDAVAHPHFICTECGTVECLPIMQFVLPRAKTPRAVKQRQIEVHLRGLCDACA
jgi:Fur family ferric uptake transcriptional regulator